jgi:hypothetical protein
MLPPEESGCKEFILITFERIWQLKWYIHTYISGLGDEFNRVVTQTAQNAASRPCAGVGRTAQMQNMYRAGRIEGQDRSSIYMPGMDAHIDRKEILLERQKGHSRCGVESKQISSTES